MLTVGSQVHKHKVFGVSGIVTIGPLVEISFFLAFGPLGLCHICSSKQKASYALWSSGYRKRTPNLDL